LAIIHGIADSEISLLDKLPDEVKNIDDIPIVHKKLKDGLAEQKKDFFEKVPSRIIREEQKLDKIKAEEKITEQKFDEKIKKLEEKKAEGGFSGFSASFKGYVVKNYSKKREINKIKELQKEQELHINAWKENPEGIFNKTQKETISEIKEFDKIKKDPFYAGAKGENKVIDELSKLDDSYHILAGVEVTLSRWVTYNGKKNLKSAQMDIVVVCPKGVFMIEVKNYSDDFVRNQRWKFSPYEQTERAGRVLWILLQDVIKGTRVTNILLSIQGNMPYNQNYRSVFVSSLNKINQFLENRQDSLNEKDVNKIVKNLQRSFTW
jgi:hypothetical protein